MHAQKRQNELRIDRLNAEKRLPHEEWTALLSTWDDSDRAYAAGIARGLADARFGHNVFVRGIVEFSNVCRNDCLYCGIRKSNLKCERYRLTEAEIVECCDAGYEYGFRTFVLQSGEDASWPPKRLAALVRTLKTNHPDCAVTLSVGELERDEYQLLFDAGADRYLLRHETADPEHYAKLHMPVQSWARRMRCLRDLKEIGFQTGCGFMVGSPYQTPDTLAKDMEFITEFRPAMIGIGPFIPHCDTPFGNEPAGSVELTLFLLSLCRILHPDVLLPATTALGTMDPAGREKGVLAGANVIMPNLSPEQVRAKYMLYNNKTAVDVDTHITTSDLQARLRKIGFTIKVSRGDYGETSC
ncbi:MAG: [Lentisphaeria bacterium]|nr:[FeFe] hydrogenase H-cluster radical SAM maturase HydE [Lentisphaeria bacterium]